MRVPLPMGEQWEEAKYAPLTNHLGRLCFWLARLPLPGAHSLASGHTWILLFLTTEPPILVPACEPLPKASGGGRLCCYRRLCTNSLHLFSFGRFSVMSIPGSF